MDKKLTFIVPDDCDKMLALSFLKHNCNLSSRMITRLKREKDGILMNGKILRTIDFVSKGSKVEINLPNEKSTILPIKGEVDVLFEDKHLIIVNKPPRMPVHPVKEHQTDTLANIITYYAMQKGENYVFRAINRLDKDTSGIVIIAKDRFTANSLKTEIFKKYYAICHGRVEQNGTIDKPIGLTENSIIVRHVCSDGQPAITHYKVLKTFSNISLLELTLETGRTHQIRCHMSNIGYPLLGDDLYGGQLDIITRQALHCGYAEFVHPVSKQKVIINSQLPSDMKNILDAKKED